MRVQTCYLLLFPVESIELLLQIIVEESRSAFSSGLEEDTAAWVRDYLHTHMHTCTGMQENTYKHVTVQALEFNLVAA